MSIQSALLTVIGLVISDLLVRGRQAGLHEALCVEVRSPEAFTIGSDILGKLPKCWKLQFQRLHVKWGSGVGYINGSNK